MKKLTALILTALMILAALPMMAVAGRFEDVANEKWYSEGISFCAANGYMAGTSETVFDRNAELTRAMFMTILAKVDGADLAEYEGKSSFEDVKTDGWYTSAIEWAYQNKLASGMGFNKDGEIVFGYKNPVTREQMSTFLYAYAEYVNLKAEYGEDMPDVYPLPTPVPDSDSINKEPVYKSYEEVYAMIAGGNHRDIGELQSETQEMVSLGGYFSQYYQSYVSSTHDVRYVFVSSEEYEMDAEWDWLPVGTRDNYSLENLGKEVEDQSGLESFTPPIDTTLRADLWVFKDADRVHEWAKGSMEWAVACELFSGIGEDLLDPRGNCTRAQAAVLIRAFVLGFLCDCEHEWTEATCTEMSVCTKCGLKNATELGHDYPKHLCTDSVKCNRCDVMSEITEHNAAEPTCTDDGYCIVCGHKTADAKGHDMQEATCASPSRCSRCGITSGSAKEHEFIGLWCTAYGFCKNCRKAHDPIGHTTSNGICSRCGADCFATIHNKVVYYINTKGEDLGNGLKGFHYSTLETNSDGGYVYYDNYAYLTPGDSVVYLLEYMYDYDTGITYSAEVMLTDSTSDSYRVTASAFDDEGTYYILNGRILAIYGGWRSIMVDEYNGSAENKGYAVYVTNDLLSKMIDHGSLNMSSKKVDDFREYFE